MKNMWTRRNVLTAIARALLAMAVFSFLAWRFEHPPFGFDIAIQVAIVGLVTAFVPIFISNRPFQGDGRANRTT